MRKRIGLASGAGCLLVLVVTFMPACSEGSEPAAGPLFVPAPGSPIPISGGAGNVAAGDLNSDGKLDVVVAGGGGISVLLGKGDGRFELAPGSPLTLPDSPGEIVLSDLDGDRRLDLAVASHDSYGVMLLLGDGDGGFALARNSPVVMREGRSPHTHGLNAGDIDGDGDVDLVTVNSDDSDVSVALGDGRGGFQRMSISFPVGASPYPGALGDLDGDGRLDIVATTTSRRSAAEEVSTRALTVLFGDGRGGFRRSQVPLRTILPFFVAVADVDGDGKPDLVVTHAERSELSVLLGDGKGGFVEASGSPFDLGHPAWHVAIFDIDGDRNADVVAAAGDGLRVMLGDGKGGFEPAPGSPFASGKGSWRLAAGDLNGDGRTDVAASNVEADSVTVLLAR